MIIPALSLIASAFAWPLAQDGLAQPLSVAGMIACLGAAWWLKVVIMVVRYPGAKNGGQVADVATQGFGVLTLLPFLWSVALLRAYQYDLEPMLGAKLVFLVCLLVWAADSGAYFVGKRFGKRKMAPNVSPNKTVEGLVGGLVAAVLAMMGAAQWLDIPYSSLPLLALIALMTSLASVFGDLAESMFKRVAGIKDSGRILPGHGGILDRIDSLTAAFPVFASPVFWADLNKIFTGIYAGEYINCKYLFYSENYLPEMAIESGLLIDSFLEYSES